MNKNVITNYQQQGDVLIKSIDKLPNNLVATYKTKKEKANYLQEGEVTGHAHRLQGVPGKDFEVYTDDGIFTNDKKKFLRVINPVALTHEEHHKQVIDPGLYEIGIVREFDHFEGLIRSVAD